MKKILISTVAVFVAIFIMDYIIHELILKSTYQAMGDMMRHGEDFKFGVMLLVTLITSFCLSFIYAKFVNPKSTNNAILFGFLLGIAHGVGMGYGTYASMPIPYYLAFSWFISTVIELSIVGFVMGMIIKE